MRFRRSGALAVALALAGAAGASPSHAAEPASPTAGLTIDRLEWSGAAAPSAAVVVENDYGDIRARTSPDGTVSVTTVVQRLDSAGEKLALSVERAGGSLVVRVAYPPLAAPDPETRAKRERRDRADLVIFVPEGLAIEARTAMGEIQAEELECDLDAATESGRIRVSSRRSVRARTTSGAIFLALAEPEWNRDMVVESDTGAVSVELPAAANLDIRAATRGRIETSYPAKVESREGVNRATFRVGRGGNVLAVRSTSGALRIVGMPAMKEGR